MSERVELAGAVVGVDDEGVGGEVVAGASGVVGGAASEGFASDEVDVGCERGVKISRGV